MSYEAEGAQVPVCSVEPGFKYLQLLLLLPFLNP